MEQIIPRVTNKWSKKKLFYGFAFDRDGEVLYRSNTHVSREAVKHDLARFARSHPLTYCFAIMAHEATRKHYRWYIWENGEVVLKAYEVLHNVVNT